MSNLPGDVTGLLLEWRGGNEDALSRLIPLVHEELHRLADRYIQRERAGHTLQATALVNEAYLRLIDAKRVQWRDRAHFLAISARLMRQVLVDYARSRGSQKRGGDAVRVTLVEEIAAVGEPDLELVALDDALQALAKFDERKSCVVELRSFGGLSVEETAAVLHVSPDTVMRDWKLAKAWLLRELGGGHGENEGRRS
jgi:RNA polymerase sigma factor (TIGR02999 family)